MPKNFYQTIFFPFFHAAGATLYIVAISWFMIFAPEIPEVDVSFLGPALMLMLFVLSAATMAILFFLKPVLLFVEGKIKEGLWFLGLTVAWFVFLVAAVFGIFSFL
jgi:hypothetical protein